MTSKRIDDLPPGSPPYAGSSQIELSIPVLGGVSSVKANLSDVVVSSSQPLLPFFGNALQVGWTRPSFTGWLNQTGAGLTDNAGGPLIMDVGLTSAINMNGNLIAVLKPAPTPPFTITSATVFLGNAPSGTTVQASCPIILNNSSQNKACAFFSSLYQYYNIAVRTAHYSNTVPGHPSDATLPESPYGFPAWGYFQWYRVIHDGTNLTYQISQEGAKFYTVAIESATALVSSFDTVGFGLDPSILAGESGKINQSPLLYQGIGLWQWTD